MDDLFARLERDPHFRRFYFHRARRRHARTHRSFKRLVERSSLGWGDLTPGQARRWLSGLRNP
jgi:hypothetical protein